MSKYAFDQVSLQDNLGVSWAISDAKATDPENVSGGSLSLLCSTSDMAASEELQLSVTREQHQHAHRCSWRQAALIRPSSARNFAIFSFGRTPVQRPSKFCALPTASLEHQAQHPGSLRMYDSRLQRVLLHERHCLKPTDANDSSSGLLYRHVRTGKTSIGHTLHC